MKAWHRQWWTLLLLLGFALASAGCQRRNAADTASPKIDRAAEVIAGSADAAASAAEALAGKADEAAAVAVDAAVTARVKSALISELDVAALRIRVDTRDGIVTLSGSVGSPRERDRAKRAAKAVAGVRYVLDDIVVKAARMG